MTEYEKLELIVFDFNIEKNFKLTKQEMIDARWRDFYALGIEDKKQKEKVKQENKKKKDMSAYYRERYQKKKAGLCNG